jgi:hypothetical protein
MGFGLLLALSAVVAFNIPAVQDYCAQRAAAFLSKKFNTEVKIGSLRLTVSRNILLRNVLIRDYNNDTMIAARKMDVHFSGSALFKKQILVKDISLDGAYFHMFRDTNGKINFNEVFAIKKRKHPAQKPAASLSLQVEVKELSLLNTHFDYQDKISGTTVRVDVDRMLARMRDVGITSGKMKIHSLTLVHPEVDIVIDPSVHKKKSDTLKPVHFMLGNFKIEFGDVLLTNGRVRVNNIQKPMQVIGMDYHHLDIRAINLKVSRGWLNRDTICATIRQLSARERCGLIVSTLRTEALVTPQSVECRKLILQTPNSLISHFVSLQFSHFHDFNEFIAKVRMKGDFFNSKVSLKDVNYFAKKLTPVQHNTIFVSGKLDGRVNNLRGRDVELRTGTSTYFKGSFFTYGLPDVFETSINLRVNQLTTRASDLQSLFPSLKIPEQLSSLGNISFTGKLDGFITDIFSQGKFHTSIGSAQTDLSCSYDKQSKTISYQGNLALNDFDLGKFTRNEKVLGTITAEAVLEGKGFKLDEIDANINGIVRNISIMQYRYQNAAINGWIKKGTFVGKFSIQDKNIDVDFDGMAKLNKLEPEFNFISTIRHANLQALNLNKQPLSLRADLSSNFIGKNLDDIIGTIVVRNLYLQNADTNYYLDFVQLQAYDEGQQKKSLFLRSKIAELEMEGFYSFSKLLPTLQHILRHTFTRTTTFDMENAVAQDFSFVVRFYDPGAITRFLHPDFKRIRNSKIQGTVSSRLNQISLNGFIPEMQWANFNFQRVKFSSGIIQQELDAYLFCDNIFFKDSLFSDTLSIEAHNQLNGFLLKLFFLDKHHQNRARMIADLFPQENSLKVQMNPLSEIWLSDKVWKFSTGNELLIKGKQITSRNFGFSNNFQSVTLDAYLKNDQSTSFNIFFSKLLISDFTKLFMPKNAAVSAELNGVITIEDAFSTPSVLADVKAHGIQLGEVGLGNLSLQSELDKERNRILINAQMDGNNNDVRAYGYYSLERGKSDINLTFDLRKLSLDFLNYPFFKPYVKDTYGKATGRLQLQGILSKLTLTGRLKIDTAAVTVSYLNTRYALTQQEVRFEENNILLTYLTIQDINDDEKRQAIANGRIYHHYFKNFGIDLRVSTLNAMMLNTNEKQNPIFYGKAFASGNISFKGLLNDLTIRANVKNMPGTHVNLPIRNTKETNKYTFFQFVDKKADSLHLQKNQKLKLNGLTFILELEANPSGRMDIVLDPVAGDILSTSGKGNIKLEIPKVGDVTMYGTYEVASGDYLFTLQNIINKRFKIEPAGTINFSGDIYQAQLNIDAVYNVRTSTYDLISDFFERNSSGSAQQTEAESRARIRIPVKLLMKLTGALSAPNVAFDIKVIDPDPSIKNLVENRLQIIRNNETEMNKEVFGLLVMNRFLPPGNTLNNAVGTDAIGGGVANTLGEFLSSQLSLYLNNFFSNFVSDFDVNFGYRQYNQQALPTAGAPNANLDSRTELQLALTKRFLNDRLSLSAGGNVDFGSTTVTDNSGTATNRVATANVAGDFQIEYILDKEGTWRAKAFNRTDYDNFNLRNRNRTGVGISFRKDFDKFKELFKRKKKKVAPPPTPDAEIRDDELIPEDE